MGSLKTGSLFQTKMKKRIVPQFESLPSEIILKILKLLPKIDLIKTIPLVSRKFYTFSKDLSLKLYFRMYVNGPAPSSFPGFLCGRAQQLEKLTVVWSRPEEPQAEESDKDTFLFFDITKFFVDNVFLPQNYFSRLFCRQNSLKKFCFRVRDGDKINQFNEFLMINSYFNSPKVYSTDVYKPTQSLSGIRRCQSLEHVDVYLVQISLCDAVEVVALRRLKVLKVNFSNEVTVNDFIKCFSNAKCESLTQLSIRLNAVDDRCLNVIAQKFRNLENICVNARSRNNSITFDGIMSLIAACPKIKFVQIFGLNFVPFQIREMEEPQVLCHFQIVNNFMDGNVTLYKRN